MLYACAVCVPVNFRPWQQVGAHRHEPRAPDEELQEHHRGQAPADGRGQGEIGAHAGRLLSRLLIGTAGGPPARRAARGGRQDRRKVPQTKGPGPPVPRAEPAAASGRRRPRRPAGDGAVVLLPSPGALAGSGFHATEGLNDVTPARRRLHRQRLHRPLPHPLVGGRARARHPRRLEPQPRRGAAEAAALARELRVGDARPYASIEEMVADPAIDCVWSARPEPRADREPRGDPARAAEGRASSWHRDREAAGPQRRRGEAGGRARRAHRRACTATSRTSSSRPGSSAGRTIVWARGAAIAGRPYLARAAEEHSGPHCRGSGAASCRAAACSPT